MEQVPNFLTQLWNELRLSLLDTFSLFQGEETTSVEILADLLNEIVVSVVLAIIFIAAYLLLRRVLKLIYSRFNVPRDISRPVNHGLRYTIVVFSILAILSQFGVNRTLTTSIAGAAVVAFLFYIGWILTTRVLANVTRRYDIDASLGQLFQNILLVLVVTFAFVSVMAQFEIDVVSVVAAFGVIGIAVGFAAQETLSNFISGITLLLERPFNLGDWVEINGQVGRVQAISLRTTRLITRDNVFTSIPNASVASGDIINFSGGGPLRVTLPVGIAYKESAKKAREVMMPVLENHKNVMASPKPEVRMVELGDSSVNLKLFYWIVPEDIGAEPKISAEILESCKEVLDDAGIEIPFPHLQLFVDEAKGLESVLEPLTRRGA